MKTLYFDCSAGISGDMTLGALLDLGIDKEKFVEEMSKLNVDGYDIVFGRAVKNGIGANKVDVMINVEGYDEEGQPLEHTTTTIIITTTITNMITITNMSMITATITTIITSMIMSTSTSTITIMTMTTIMTTSTITTTSTTTIITTNTEILPMFLR